MHGRLRNGSQFKVRFSSLPLFLPLRLAATLLFALIFGHFFWGI
jgi:hypothetical protein